MILKQLSLHSTTEQTSKYIGVKRNQVLEIKTTNKNGVKTKMNLAVLIRRSKRYKSILMSLKKTEIGRLELPDKIQGRIYVNFRWMVYLS